MLRTKRIRILLWINIILLMVASGPNCCAQTEIKGSIKANGQGKSLSNVDLVLYQQNNLSTTAKTNDQGEFKIKTDQIGNVVLVVNRQGFTSATETITIDGNQNGPITKDFNLKSLPPPETGEEKISCSIPALIPGSKLESYINARPKLKSIAWKFEVASSAFGAAPTWDEVEEKNGASQFADFELKEEFCKNFEHRKVRVSANIVYEDGSKVEKTITHLISSRSILISGKGWEK